MAAANRHRIMILAMAVVAIGLASAGPLARGTLAAPDTSPGASSLTNGAASQNRSDVADDGKNEPRSDSAEAEDQVILMKSEEVVQDGTTSWGAEADQTYISPRYVKKNFLTIRAKTDHITVKSISVDRGNCTAFALALPAAMKFGESYKVLVLCDPLEAIVDTDHGAYSFSWDQ